MTEILDPSVSNTPFKTFGIDELNICEFPLFTSNHLDDRNRELIFEDEVFDAGSKRKVERKLSVSASQVFGLPTPADSDVLLVLMQLSKLRHDFSSATIEFSRRELLELLGWSDGGQSYRRLEDSLNRWAGVTLQYKKAWWDRTGQKWRSRTFHIIEAVDLQSQDELGQAGQTSSSITWSSVLLESFQANNVKRLDLNTYFQLKSPTAKQAYRFLDKRFYRSDRFEMNLRTFACEHLGISRTHDNSQLQRRLRGTFDELEEIQFLKPSKNRFQKRGRGEWSVVLQRQRTTRPSVKASPILSALIERGVHRVTAKSLVKNFPEEHINAKLAHFDEKMNSSNKPKNPAGFLAASIRDDYVTEQAKPKPSKKSIQPKPVKAEQNSSLADHSNWVAFQQLSVHEQQTIETAALADSSQIFRGVYERQQGKPAAKNLQMELIVSYLSKHPVLIRKQ